jgi:hypothetical protein
MKPRLLFAVKSTAYGLAVAALAWQVHLLALATGVL